MMLMGILLEMAAKQLEEQYKMEKFPLIKAMGLKIFDGNPTSHVTERMAVDAYDLERILESARVFYGSVPQSEWTLAAKGSDTHTARLICIEEIRKDTAGGLVKEMIEQWDNWGHRGMSDWIDRAKKLLDRTKESK